MVKTAQHIHRHKDGSLWAKGNMTGDQCDGYWEWFRKDGSKMRSGFFDKGEQIGEWTTYDKKGKIVKVTKMKAMLKMKKIIVADLEAAANG